MINQENALCVLRHATLDLFLRRKNNGHLRLKPELMS